MAKTVSRGLAERLKATGLEWTPKPGDWYEDGWQGRHFVINPEDVSFKESMTWLPTLPDLLERLEERGYEVDIRVARHQPRKYECVIRNEKWDIVFSANTRENAAGEAMLWVLEQEAKHMGIR